MDWFYKEVKIVLSLLLAVNTETVKKSVTILWQGLLAIFVVVCIVIAVTYLLKYVVTKVAESKKAKEEVVNSTKNDD